MKTIKKLLAALCAMTLVIALGVPAGVFAAGETYSLTLNNTGETAHTFEIYQIFTGDLYVDNGVKVLSNVVWGDGVNEPGQLHFGSASAKAETLTSEALAKAFAADLVSGDYLTNAAVRTVAAGESLTISGLTPGYYLVKDTDESQYGDNSAYTAYILEVVGDVTASAKLDVPSVQKFVRDINDTNDGDISDNDWVKTADHDVLDNVPFLLVGTLPDNYDEYDAYYYSFTDALSPGLTYNNDVRIFVDNEGTETEVTNAASLSITPTSDGTELSIVLPDLKDIAAVTADSRIIVRYTAQLNDSAVIGGSGNTNSVYLTYSNDPNPNGYGVGTTPKDNAVVFTYALVVDKVDENEDPLQGAGFTLYKQDSLGAWNAVSTIAAGTAASFTFSGLDDGTYKLVESETPGGYNTINDIVFTITASQSQGAAPQLIELMGVDSDGGIAVLDDGTELTVSLSTGTISTDIVNKSGSVLPSTGGVGTVIFYVCGGVLALGALVLIITKKRMKAED